MTSSTLYREGDDLDTLLAELSTEFGSRVRIVAVDEDRPAGVRGFLTRRRVSVQYVVDPADESGEDASGDPLAGLIARAEAAETGSGRPRSGESAPITAAPAVDAPAGNAEFASMLLELAAAKAAQRAESAPTYRPSPGPAAARPATAFTAPPPVLPPDPPAAARPMAPAAPRPFAPAADRPFAPAADRPFAPAAPLVLSPTAEPLVTVAARPPAVPAPVEQFPGASDAALVLRRRLADIGVPIHLLPSAAGDPVAAVRKIVAALPAAPHAPIGRGAILAVVGPAAAARATAERLCSDLGITLDRVWAAGLPDGALPGAVVIRDAWDAATAAQAARDRLDRLVVAVVATDGDLTGGRNRRPGRILTALQADAVWAVVDATRKATDSRHGLAALGPVTAAVVIDAAETTSPATVLELGVPVALLDGEPATPQRWAAALLDALLAQEP